MFEYQLNKPIWLILINVILVLFLKKVIKKKNLRPISLVKVKYKKWLILQIFLPVNVKYKKFSILHIFVQKLSTLVGLLHCT